MELFFIKIFVTITIVLGLSVIAERVGPKWAGFLGGYPLGVAIALIFISYQEGAAFGAQSVVHTLASMSANLAVFAAYGIVLTLRPQSSFITAGLCSILAFLIVAIPLGKVDFNLIGAVFFIVTIIIACIFAFRKFEESQIRTAVKLSLWVAFARASMACVVVLTVTGLAGQLGPEMAGVFAGFPATVFPLVIIVHYTYGPAPVLTIIKHLPSGLGSMITFGIVYALCLEDFGLLWGTVASFVMATVYLFIFKAVQDKIRRASN